MDYWSATSSGIFGINDYQETGDAVTGAEVRGSDSYHTVGTSTSAVVGGDWGSSSGITETTLDPESWTTTEQVVIDNIYHPATDPVYGEPYTGCGYDYYSKRNPVRNKYRTYRVAVGSTEVIEELRIATAVNLCSLPKYDSCCTGCYCDEPSEERACPIAGVHLPSSRGGRPYSTVITPGQPAWNEPVYGNVTTTHYHDDYGARGPPFHDDFGDDVGLVLVCRSGDTGYIPNAGIFSDEPQHRSDFANTGADHGR